MKGPNITTHQMVNPRHDSLSEATLASGCGWVAKVERKMASRAAECLALVRVDPSTQETRIRAVMDPDSPGELRVLFYRVNEV